MTVRPLPLRPHLTRQGDSALAELLHHARAAAADRAALRADASYWQAAETRSAMAMARADQIFGGRHDARTLLAVLMAVVARADLHGPDAQPHGSRLSSSPAKQVFDSTTMAGWLRATSSTTSSGEVYADGAAAAEEVLASDLGAERLAAAWTSVCGVSLLELVAQVELMPAADQPSVSEVRLLQRVTSHCLATNRGMTPAQLTRLVGSDRRTMSTWLRYGPPSRRNTGHLVPARHCATIAGMSLGDWRTVQDAAAGCQATVGPRARVVAPPPVAGRRAVTWDEGEVMEWFESHPAYSCEGRCRRHSTQSVPVAAVAGGGDALATPRLSASDHRSRRWLHSV
ncbi:hypothetical protein [Janibacter terrae]|uniref:hypothetical protein n=1 Tax=Janibacter terrae TaxID=103817 RepID=UPI000ACBC4AA|nr:hypothetical protein [Janibacter terrae]